MALGDDEVIACGCGFDDVSFPHDCKTGKQYATKTKMTKEIVYVVVGHDGCEIHVEKVFENAVQAIEYAEECTMRTNESYGEREYHYSVLKRELMKWSEECGK